MLVRVIDWLMKCQSRIIVSEGEERFFTNNPNENDYVEYGKQF